MPAETRASAAVSSGYMTTDVNARKRKVVLLGRQVGHGVRRAEGGRQSCRALGPLQRQRKHLNVLDSDQLLKSAKISKNPVLHLHNIPTCHAGGLLFWPVLRSHHSLSLRAATPRSGPGGGSTAVVGLPARL